MHPNDLGDDRRPEYVDAVLRVSAIRWAGAWPARQPGPLTLSAAPGSPGQTCVALEDAHRPRAGAVIRRCTYGMVRMASIQAIPQGPALVLAVQPLESWRELWVFHEKAGSWTIDVLSPGLDNPEEGYVDFAGYAPGTRRLLIAREVKDRGRFRRSFEELRLDDLALVRQASTSRAVAGLRPMAGRRMATGHAGAALSAPSVLARPSAGALNQANVIGCRGINARTDCVRLHASLPIRA